MGIAKPRSVQPGERYGKLTVTSFSHSDKKRRYFNAVCDCGRSTTVMGSHLRGGNTKSCGCLRRIAKLDRRLPNDRGVINHIILQYKRHARDRGIRWGLAYEDVERLVRGACRYCGDPAGNLKITKNHSGFAHNGIDRCEPSKPYTTGNCVSCCGKCNIAKGTMTAGEFISHAKRIADQWGGYLQSLNDTGSKGTDGPRFAVSDFPFCHAGENDHD